MKILFLEMNKRNALVILLLLIIVTQIGIIFAFHKTIDVLVEHEKLQTARTIEYRMRIFSLCLQQLEKDGNYNQLYFKIQEELFCTLALASGYEMAGVDYKYDNRVIESCYQCFLKIDIKRLGTGMNDDLDTDCFVYNVKVAELINKFFNNRKYD